jgi:hypothetical protein
MQSKKRFNLHLYCYFSIDNSSPDTIKNIANGETDHIFDICLLKKVPLVDNNGFLPRQPIKYLKQSKLSIAFFTWALCSLWWCSQNKKNPHSEFSHLYGSPKVKGYDENANQRAREDSLNQLDEARDVAMMHSARYQQALRRYQAQKIRRWDFDEGDLVLRLQQDNRGRHKLSPPWRGALHHRQSAQA